MSAYSIYSTKRKYPKKIYLFLSIFTLFTSVFCGTFVLEKETRAPEVFPETDIVFSSSDGVGFVNADGTNVTSLPFVARVSSGKVKGAWRPVITEDYRTIIMKVTDPFTSVDSPRALVMWREGTLPIYCASWPDQQVPLLAADQKHLFIQTEIGIAMYPLDSCGASDAPVATYKGIQGVISPNLYFVVYARQGDDLYRNRFLVLRNIESGEETEIGEGDFPAWSRDGQQIAYTGPDGIYIVSIEQPGVPKRILKYLNPFDELLPTYSVLGDYYKIPIEPSWSPDGFWLVYHKWQGEDPYTGISPVHNTIYKLNIETGEEIKIIDGGMYPFWRWPVEKP